MTLLVSTRRAGPPKRTKWQRADESQELTSLQASSPFERITVPATLTWLNRYGWLQ